MHTVVGRLQVPAYESQFVLFIMLLNICVTVMLLCVNFIFCEITELK